MASEQEKYKVMQEQQKIFREAVSLMMSGNLDGLQKLLDGFIKSNPSVGLTEVFTGFRSEGRTLVHIAASSGNSPILNYVFEKMKNSSSYINNGDDRGFTPLMYATISESTHSDLKLLVSHGADVNARNGEGASSLHFAAGDGSISRMEVLCDAGADINVQSKSGAPIHWAAGKARADAIKFLIDRKADINATSPEGLPAVIMASVSGCNEGVKYLVEAGADIGALVSGNLTALHICAEHGLDKAVEAMVATETGRKCCLIETTDGNKPIHLAAMSEYRDIVRMLIPVSELPAEFTELSGEAAVEAVIRDGAKRLDAWNAAHNVHKEDSTVALNPTAGGASGDGPIEDFIEEASEQHKAEAERFKELGNSLFKTKAYSHAIEAYNKAIEHNRKNATYWSNRSACYLAMEDGQKALADAEVCRRLRPDWTKGCYRLAAARLFLNQFEDAAVAAFEGCKLDEGNKDLKALLQLAVKKGQEDHKKKIAEANVHNSNSSK